MNISEITIDGYEKVLHGTDIKTGLNAYVAVHNTNLGPALGGCRYFSYKNNEEQLNDTLRLAKGMTYKNALAGLNWGGGKATICKPSNKFLVSFNGEYHKTTEFWKSFAELVNEFSGKYITSGDVGTSARDLQELCKYTNFIVGQNNKVDSGAATAYGVFQSIKALNKFVFGTNSLEGKTISVQGIGKVGRRLIDYCLEEKAKVIATDIDIVLFDQYYFSNENVLYTLPEKIYEAECDFFSPCSVGGVLNNETIPKLNCKGIAGGANNQLGKDEDVLLLKNKNIYYIPDYLANSGGVRYVEKNQENNTLSKKVKEELNILYDMTLDVLEESLETWETTTEICDKLAEKRFLN